MKSEKERFPFKKILEYLTREETSFMVLKSFFRNTQQGQRKNAQTISQISRQLGAAAEKVTNKQLSKMIKNFTIQKMQYQHAGSNSQLVAEKLNYWIDQVTDKYKIVKDKAKNMERRKQSLTDPEIEAYKKQLTEDMISVTKSRDSVITLFCYHMIKNSSQQLETLTNLLQVQSERSNMVHKEK